MATDIVAPNNLKECYELYVSLKKRNNSAPIEARYWRQFTQKLTEILSSLSHKQRYPMHEIGEIIKNTCGNIDFSAETTRIACDEMENYALLLAIYPWKKEYRKIKLHSGSFNTRVSTGLSNVITIFLMLGYVQSSGDLLELHQEPDITLCFAVAFTLFMAACECRTVHSIYTQVGERYSESQTMQARMLTSGGVRDVVSCLWSQFEMSDEKETKHGDRFDEGRSGLPEVPRDSGYLSTMASTHAYLSSSGTYGERSYVPTLSTANSPTARSTLPPGVYERPPERYASRSTTKTTSRSVGPETDLRGKTHGEYGNMAVSTPVMYDVASTKCRKPPAYLASNSSETSSRYSMTDDRYDSSLANKYRLTTSVPSVPSGPPDSTFKDYSRSSIFSASAPPDLDSPSMGLDEAYAAQINATHLKNDKLYSALSSIVSGPSISNDEASTTDGHINNVLRTLNLYDTAKLAGSKRENGPYGSRTDMKQASSLGTYTPQRLSRLGDDSLRPDKTDASGFAARSYLQRSSSPISIVDPPVHNYSSPTRGTLSKARPSSTSPYLMSRETYPPMSGYSIATNSTGLDRGSAGSSHRSLQPTAGRLRSRANGEDSIRVQENSVGDDVWSCPACTFVNSGKNWMCTVCGWKKPDLAASLPQSCRQDSQV